MGMKFSKIDLEKYRTVEVKSIFTRRGSLSDGRPYVVECWAEDHITMLTVYMSPIGFQIDAHYKLNTSFKNKEMFCDILEYLVSENIINKLPESVSAYCFGSEDDRIISINIFVGMDD
jgi:hypothetical protein